jgi:hypothetical protein
MPSANQKINKFAKKNSTLLSPERLESIADELDSLLGTDQQTRVYSCYFHSQIAAAILERECPGRFQRVLVGVGIRARMGSGALFTIRLDARVDADEYHYSLLDDYSGYILDYQLPYWAERYKLARSALGGNPRYIYQIADRQVGNLRLDILDDALRDEIDCRVAVGVDYAAKERENQRLLAMI